MKQLTWSPIKHISILYNIWRTVMAICRFRQCLLKPLNILSQITEAIRCVHHHQMHTGLWLGAWLGCLSTMFTWHEPKQVEPGVFIAQPGWRSQSPALPCSAPQWANIWSQSTLNMFGWPKQLGFLGWHHKETAEWSKLEPSFWVEQCLLKD